MRLKTSMFKSYNLCESRSVINSFLAFIFVCLPDMDSHLATLNLQQSPNVTANHDQQMSSPHDRLVWYLPFILITLEVDP